MKPIAKAMTAALTAMTTACVAPGAPPKRATVMPDMDRQRTIAATADGFVIRAAIPGGPVGIPTPATRNHVPIGAGTHIDAGLLFGPASSIQEISHAHP